MLFSTLILVLGVFGTAQASVEGTYEVVLQKYLRWNYTYMNPNCTGADGGQNPCEDIRVCRFAVASLTMGGWPTLCGWIGAGTRVPKVCCGLPLVLGPALMKKVDVEKARNRRCGTKTFQSDISPTEEKFFKILKTVPHVDISDPSKFDPPLEFAQPMVSPVGGTPSREGDFPWMVSIRKSGSHWCGGTLIDRRHILSAAHCFVKNNYKPDPNDYTVHIGNLHVDEDYPYRVKKVAVHPEYNPRHFYYDIALLTLDEEILTPLIAHICLPPANLDISGKNTTLLGWEDMSFGEKTTPTMHIVDDLPVIPYSECKKSYRRVAANVLPHGLTEDFICAGLSEGKKDACQIQQDSGGPLMYKYNPTGFPGYDSDVPWVIVGIVSFGYNCGESRYSEVYPGVYTKVSSYLDWIYNSTKY